jgi:L-amino acid N-acyltransferase YncA
MTDSGPKTILYDIRTAIPEDAVAVTEIYNYYVQHTVATFQEDILPVASFQDRIVKGRQKGFPFLVAVAASDNLVSGYIYVSEWSDRTAYRHTIATSIFLRPEAVAKGLGKRMVTELHAVLRETGMKQVIARISILPEQALDEVPSCRLHMSMGYCLVGRLIKVGFKLGKWVDVALLQYSLDESVAGSAPRPPAA